MVMMAGAAGTPPGGVPPLKIWIVGTPTCETHERIELLGRNQALRDGASRREDSLRVGEDREVESMTSSSTSRCFFSAFLLSIWFGEAYEASELAETNSRSSLSVHDGCLDAIVL